MYVCMYVHPCVCAGIHAHTCALHVYTCQQLSLQAGGLYQGLPHLLCFIHTELLSLNLSLPTCLDSDRLSAVDMDHSAWLFMSVLRIRNGIHFIDWASPFHWELLINKLYNRFIFMFNNYNYLISYTILKCLPKQNSLETHRNVWKIFVNCCSFLSVPSKCPTNTSSYLDHIHLGYTSPPFYKNTPMECSETHYL